MSIWLRKRGDEKSFQMHVVTAAGQQPLSRPGGRTGDKRSFLETM
jgi:hypothetical protein